MNKKLGLEINSTWSRKTIQYIVNIAFSLKSSITFIKYIKSNKMKIVNKQTTYQVSYQEETSL